MGHRRHSAITDASRPPSSIPGTVGDRSRAATISTLVVFEALLGRAQRWKPEVALPGRAPAPPSPTRDPDPGCPGRSRMLPWRYASGHPLTATS